MPARCSSATIRSNWWTFTLVRKRLQPALIPASRANSTARRFSRYAPLRSTALSWTSPAPCKANHSVDVPRERRVSRNSRQSYPGRRHRLFHEIPEIMEEPHYLRRLGMCSDFVHGIAVDCEIMCIAEPAHFV